MAEVVRQYFQKEIRLSKVLKERKGENALETENSLSRDTVRNTQAAKHLVWLEYGTEEDNGVT